MRCWLVIAIAIAVTACRTDAEHSITRWTFEHEGKTAEVDVPIHLDVPDRETTFVLRVDLAVPPELRDVPLALVIPSFAGLASLFVDDIAAVAIDTDLVRGYRGR